MKRLGEWLRALLRRLLDVPSRGSVNIGDQATLEVILSQGKMINGRITSLESRLNEMRYRLDGFEEPDVTVKKMAVATTLAVSDILTEMEKFKELVKLASDGITLRGIAEELIAEEDNSTQPLPEDWTPEDEEVEDKPCW